MSDFEWMRDAGCLGVIDAMWDQSTPSVDALRMCFRCPVIRQCARYGLSRPYASDAGVLGAMGLYDRQRVRAGKATVPQMWAFRLRELVAADWEAAKDEQYARSMPRLALA
jgi:hypothetical protein